MKLADIAKRKLEPSFEIFGHYWNNMPITDDVWNTYKSGSIIREEYRMGDKVMYSLMLEEQKVPFAMVEKNLLRFKTKTEILPCLIPDALRSLALYKQVHEFSKKENKRISSIQKSLYSLIK